MKNLPIISLDYSMASSQELVNLLCDSFGGSEGIGERDLGSGTAPDILLSFSCPVCWVGESTWVRASLTVWVTVLGDVYHPSPCGWSSGFLASGHLRFHGFTSSSYANMSMFYIFHDEEMVRKHLFKWLLSSFLPLMVSDFLIPWPVHCLILTVYVHMWAENGNALGHN